MTLIFIYLRVAQAIEDSEFGVQQRVQHFALGARFSPVFRRLETKKSAITFL